MYNKDMNHIYLNRTITYVCEELHIPIPEIYYIYQDYYEFRLFDRDMNILSYDHRDCEEVKHVKLHNHCLFINVNSLKQPVLLISLTVRELRELYQDIQLTSSYKEITEEMEREWRYCKMRKASDGKYRSDAPDELDKDAFAYVYMSDLYHIILHFPLIDDHAIDDKILYIERRYHFKKEIMHL